VISIDKQTEILKILYPDRIRPEDLCEVYENVRPHIQNLIDGVDLGYHCTKTIELKHVDVIADMEWTRNEDSPIQDERIQDVVTQKRPMSVDNISLHTFTEDDKHEIDTSWTELQFGKGTHYRRDDTLVIKGESSRIDTTWSYLNEFFNSLSEETIIRNVDGLNKKKQKTLFKFYVSHPNFACHIDKNNNTNVFKKDEVRLNTNTNGNGECGTMNVDDFNGVSEEG